MCPWLQSCTAKVHRELHPGNYAALPEGKRSSLPTMAQSTVSLYCLAQSPVPRTPWRTGEPQTIRRLLWRDNKTSHLERKEWHGSPRNPLRMQWPRSGLDCFFLLDWGYLAMLKVYHVAKRRRGGWRHSSKHFGGRLRACLRGLRVEPCDPSCNIMRCGYSPTALAGSTDLQQESEVSQVSDGQATRYILEPRWDAMLSCSLLLCWPTSTSSQGQH